MKLDEFDFELDEELIAQTPYLKRDEARLMVLNRKNKTIEHKVFSDIIEYLNEGDCLVINNTKVLPSRIYGYKQTGAKIEILLLKRIEGDTWEVMVRPGNKAKVGDRIYFPDYETNIMELEIKEILEGGTRKVEFKYDGIFNEILDKIGLMPLPPYIHEKLDKKEMYNTVYAKIEGSAAAPTAGLHFTKELLEKVKSKGIDIAHVTLNIGIGTFRPVKTKTIEEHKMHEEYFEIDGENVDKILKAKNSGKRVIAVGTTSARVLEAVSTKFGELRPYKGTTDIFIYPGYKYKMVDALITNFHLPKSTLIMLVSALYSKEEILKAYKIAVKERYKFFSFGDAMYIE